MAIKTIETRAVISAQDKTGAVFGAVAQKLRGLEQNAAAVSRRMDSVSRGMSAFGRANLREIEARSRIAQMGGAARRSAPPPPRVERSPSPSREIGRHDFASGLASSSIARN